MIMIPTKIFNTDSTIDNNQMFLSSNQNIRMISEESCDTDDTFKFSLF